MTIKNKKTKQSKSSEVTSTSSASTSVQKTSTSKVQQSSNTLQKVSSGKKVRYIEVKVEEDDPLMITDVSDHTSISGSTISEHYNSHPHYIITEAPSMTDLSQIRSQEHHVSDMSQATSGEFISNSDLQQSSSTSHQQSSKTETFQSSSTSVHQSGSSHSQTIDRTGHSTTGNQTLNTAFLDSSDNTSGTNITTKSRVANTSNTFLQTERQNLLNENVESTSLQSNTSSQNINQRGNVTYRDSPDTSKRIQTVHSDKSNFYGGEGTLDKDSKIKQYSSVSQSNESKSSNVTKSSSSSYVVEIIDGKEKIIDSSNREWGDSQEHSTKEAYASISGTDIKPQSAHSIQNYDMKSNYDTGKDGAKPTSSMTLKEDSKFIKDGTQVTSHASVITEKDNTRHQQISSTHDQLSSKDQQYYSKDHYYGPDRQGQPREVRYYSTDNEGHPSGSGQPIQGPGLPKTQHYSPGGQRGPKDGSFQPTDTERYPKDSQAYPPDVVYQSGTNQYSTITTSDNVYRENITNQNSTIENVSTTRDNVVDRRRNPNQTDASNFYGYDTTIQNELRKVGDILQVKDTDNINFSTKIMKSNTSSAQQASTSSYVIEVVDGKERVIDTSHREWGDNKEHSTYEKSHKVSGTGIKPEHEYTRHVLDKESHYDTGKDGIPTSSNVIAEESVLYKNGKEIAATRNVYGGDFTKKKQITEHIDIEDIHDRRILDNTDDSSNINYESTSITDTKSVKDTKDVTKTTDFISSEKQNLLKETTSDKQTKDTLTTYERSTGTWNGKFIYEKDDDRPKRPKEMSPFGRPEQPRHHLKRQDTEENIIISSRDIKDFTSISDLRKIIETSQSNKDVTVSNKNIVIKRNIDDRILKDIIETVKKYPFKRIEKVTFGTRINEDVKDLYEGVDTEETTVLTTTTGEATRKTFEVDKTRSQIEVTRYITENGITRKITTYEEPKEDEKIKTDVFVDKSAIDFKNLVNMFYICVFLTYD